MLTEELGEHPSRILGEGMPLGVDVGDDRRTVWRGVDHAVGVVAPGLGRSAVMPVEEVIDRPLLPGHLHHVVVAARGTRAPRK